MHSFSDFLIDCSIDKSAGKSPISSSRSKSDRASFDDPLQDSSPKSLLMRFRFCVLAEHGGRLFLLKSLPTFDIDGVL